MRNHLCDVLVVMILHVLFEIPLLYVDGILILSSCMFALRSLLCHVGGIIIMHEFCVILIWVFLTESSCSGTSLGATPTWGHFPCMITTSPLCTSSLLTTLNAVAYTILTLGLGDVIPLGWTLLSMLMFSCVDNFYVCLLFRMQMYSLMLF